MNLIEQLNKKELADLLGKCWMTHDGMWFYSTFLELGIEKTNQLNKAAIRALAPIEVKRFKKALGLRDRRIDTFEVFRDFFTSISELLIPDFMNVSWDFPEENRMAWEFNENGCFACNGVKLLGATDAYECGPIYRIENWLQVLEIPYDITPAIDKCVAPETGRCAGQIRIYFD